MRLTKRKVAMRKTLIAAAGALTLTVSFGVMYAGSDVTAAAADYSCSLASAGPDIIEAANNGSVEEAYQDAGDLAFKSGTGEKYYCIYEDSKTSTYEIWVADTGTCLALNATTGYIDQDAKSECNSNDGAGQTWDQWYEDYVPGTVWTLLESDYNINDCAYFNSAADIVAIWTGCDQNDQYEWFSWPGA